MQNETIAVSPELPVSGPIRILMVEDTEADGALLELELRRGGIDAHCQRVESADAMRKILRKEKFDLVLCDYILPGFSAHAALQILKDLGKEIPFIVISGVVRTADVVQVLRSGAEDFIEKEDLARFVPAVERALRSAEEHRGRIEAEEKLRQSQKMEAIGQLTGGISHDFNNLLSAIWGNLELTRDFVGGNAEAEKFIDAAIRTIQRGSELTHRLLAFAHKQPSSAKPTDVNRLVLELAELVRRTIGGGIDLQCTEAPDLWTAMVEPAQLENALLNLALNARDAMPDGGKLTIETANKNLDSEFAVHNPGVAPGQYLTIAVSDTGTGMDRDVIDRIFEPFFTTKEVGRGTGLGLSMVFGFVRQSGGHITVYSEPAQGTTFRMYLPRADRTVRAGQPAEQAKKAIGGSETILVVEDDEDVRNFVVTALEKLGYDVHQAIDGATALNLLDEGLRPRLLFTDLVLPHGMDGVALAVEVSRQYPDTGTLLTSGYADNALLRKIPPETNMRILNKPYSIKYLAEQVRAALNR